ncbi:hypothetical protein N0V83_009900 [Neocucurbitaria cava]|uniref:Uncharacterized protein n=1 Tax=Neocucurbitaria cava TaxID=798079 RepID=A0A9W8Y126_9PLEO|nr:hypothetical protein N0V83_009900 [Neocucurbitaria cava]
MPPAASCYYARKYWKYGKFEKKMRRKPGGRGYWVDPGDDGGKNKGRLGKLIGGVGKEVGGGGGHSEGDITSGEKEKTSHMEEKMDAGGGRRGGEEAKWAQVELYGGISGKEGGEYVKRPEGAVTMPNETATARFERNQFTKDGASSIWSSSSLSSKKKMADKFKSGYDGRKVRRQAWEEDLEMSEGVARK